MTLDELNALITRRERLLAKRLGWEPSPRRETLVRKLHNKLALNYTQRDELTGQPQPFDEFNVRFECEERDSKGRTWGMIYVDIFDSPLDDTFTGGDPLILRSNFVDGKGYDPETGRSWSGRGRTTTSAFANGDYWDGNNEQTLMMGSPSLGYTLENYDSGTVTLFKDPGEGSWDERIDGMKQIYQQPLVELC